MNYLFFMFVITAVVNYINQNYNCNNIYYSSLPLVNIPLPLTSPNQEWVATNNMTQDYAPFCYIQQVVLKVTVLPWEADLTLGDGFRAPLYESFKLLDIVRNYEDKSRWVYTQKIILFFIALK